MPNPRLARFAKSRLAQAYHAWDLRSQGDDVHVITDESQHGIMPALLGPVLSRGCSLYMIGGFYASNSKHDQDRARVYYPLTLD